jgi:hypothetical protein
MEALDVILDGDNAWTELRGPGMYTAAEWTAVAGLADGTSGGKPAVVVRITMPDGSAVLAQTTLRLFLMAADALKARYGDPRY